MAEVLSVAHDGAPFAHAPLRSSASHTSFFDASGPYGSPRKNAYSYSDLRSSASLSSSQSSSFHSTPASSLSLETRLDETDDEGDDADDDDADALSFPSYSTGQRYKTDPDEAPPSSPVPVTRPPASTADSYESPAATPDQLLPISEDDTAVRFEPSHHVDYLSHDWKEEDIWSSWRHIVEHRKVYGERSRLENASWRTWAKSQFKLRTVSPETLNWLKDCDVTWLYGPLQPASNRAVSQQTSEPVSRLSKTNSFLHKKPILKKRSMSEVMLQNSISSSSLVKQAAAAVQAQQLDTTGATLGRRRNRPIIGRATSDCVTSSIPSRTTSRDPTDYFSSRSTSGLQTPDHGERKHIRFDEKVEQCIAVECKDGIDDDDNDHWRHNDDDSSSDEGVVMMKRSRKRRPMSRTNSKASFTGESKIIAPLPSTTLKNRTDSPSVADEQSQVAAHSLGFWRSSRLSPSPSQETLRPSNPSANFLLADADSEDEEGDEPFQPTRAFEANRPSTPTPHNPSPNMPRIEEAGAPLSASASSSALSSLQLSSSGGVDDGNHVGGLRRTASGMYMPFDDEDENPPPPGLIGRVVDTVNTARDIAHVIWNVGWRG